MRRNPFISHPVRDFVRVKRVLFVCWVTTLLVAGSLTAHRAAAQVPRVPIIGYGQSVPGEVTNASGTEHIFTGCAGETIGFSVTANDFAPRVELYGADDDEPLASATAPARARTVVIEGQQLAASGPYVIVVGGRSRSDRGGYSLTLEGTGPDNPMPDDGNLRLNILYGDAVAGAIEAERNEQWNFHGCAGEEVLIEATGDDFTPQLRLYFPIAEVAIATSEENGARAGAANQATLRRTLPANGPYNLIVTGRNETDAGNYTLMITSAGTAAGTAAGTSPVLPPATATNTPVADTPVATAIVGATPTATPTPASGPRARRGVPTPKAPVSATQTPATSPTAQATPTRPAATPTRTFTPTPTPTPTLTPALATPTATGPTVSLEIFCTVITDRLNLRAGPGTNFNPPVDVLEIGELLVVTGRNADGTWLQVAVLDVNLEVEAEGWVSAEFVFCVGEIDNAPVIEGDA